MTSNARDLDRYLRILAGTNPTGRLIEIRAATPHGGMRQTFTPAARPDLAARTITRLAASTDVYVGVLLRRHRAGGRHACERSHLAFIEIDRPDALERLAQYRCPPSVVIASAVLRVTPMPTGSCSSPSTSTSSSKRIAGSPFASAATSPPSTPPASCGPRPPGIESAPRQRASSCS